MTADAERGQVTATAAEVYEERFVPALFEQWAGPVLDAVGARAGDRLLDVACGTGVVARAARRRGASATGLDVNDAMLAVARRVDPEVDWRQGSAQDLPFPDGRFTHLTCSFALMFLPDPGAAVAEAARVLTPGGGMAAFTTWAAVDRSPGYAALVALVERELGGAAGGALRAPFALGSPAELAAVVGVALPDVVVEERPGVARFPSLDAWVGTEIRGWTLADAVDDEAFDQLLAAARRDLAHFAGTDGHVAFPAPALLAVAPAP
jgi:SAM-dependent methyltransferase